MNKIIGVIIISLVLLTAVVSAQSLKIDNFSIKINGETELITLKKDGKVTLNGKQVGVLQTDGKLKDLQGKTIAEIDKTGKVTVSDKPRVLIDKNGGLDNGSGKILAWTKDGKFKVSESEFLTVSPNKKKFYQSASFLIFLYFTLDKVTTGSLEDKKNKCNDSDLVASVDASAMRGGYSIKVYGDGTMIVEGESFEAKKKPSDRKKVQAKITLFLQKAEAIDFATIGKKSLESTFRVVQDGSSESTGVWQNGNFQRAGCSSERDYCPQEIRELHGYFLTLFADDIVRRKL
jgi:hypothetical protein